ncbi:MAG: DNA-processing protein DprA [Muribaculaceae bacterium]|nr:DNA-processing protein DprA [Muribaculaceae bacterium]
MLSDDKILYKLAFSSLKGLTPEIASKVIEHTGSAQAFFETPKPRLLRSMPQMAKMLEQNNFGDLLESAEKVINFNNTHSIRTLFPDSNNGYPEKLTNCDDAPLRLFCLGTPPTPDAPTISIVGTRHSTNYGATFINSLMQQIAEALPKAVIVSGLAFGIDILAHRAALKNGLGTVAVLAHGLDTLYPATHRKDAAEIIKSGGALLTEYAPGVKIHKGFFLARNRIVAGMADVTIVVESALRGGAMVTARLASDYNRIVMAVPGRATDPYSEGCNDLVASNRGEMLRNVDDLLRATGWQSNVEGNQKELFSTPSKLLTPVQQRVVEFLRKNGDSHIDAIAHGVELRVHEAASILIDMDFDGLVATLPGSCYSLLI